MIDDLEKAVAHLLVHDSVAKREITCGNNMAHASEVEASISSSASVKVSKYKTCVEIRHYKQTELNKSYTEERDELVEIRKMHSKNKNERNYKKKTIFEESKANKINVSSMM